MSAKQIESLLSATPFTSVQQLMVRRKRRVLLAPGQGTAQSSESAPEKVVASFIENLQSVGYVATASFYAACEAMTVAELEDLNAWLMSALKEMRGGRPFDPMYRNFPKEVMEASKVQLYMNAVRHYWTSGRWLPESMRADRPALDENGNLLSLDLGTAEDVEQEFRRLVSANSSISAADKQDVRTLVEFFGPDVFRLIPPVIPNRENKAHLISLVWRFGDEGVEFAKANCNTATDVLRVAVAMSDGDVSLAEATKFRAFGRPERRVLLQILESQNNIIEDMLRWKERWKRLGERLHPGEKAAIFPKCVEAFKTIREDLPFETFNSKLEQVFQNKDVTAAVSMLSSRPGYFARRLDHLIRLSDEKSRANVTKAFAEVAGRVSTPVLFQVMHHFQTREAGRGNLFQAFQQAMPKVSVYEPVRVFLPKGAVNKAQVVPNRLPKISSTTCDTVALACRKTLITRFEKMPGLGKCYIDPALRKFAIPFSQRSAAKSLRTIARGSRLPMPSSSDTLRFFIWWKNGTGRTDLDLSAAAFRPDFSHHTTIAYYNLKDFGGHHSGDIVDAPEGASEFIDISISRCREQNVRYVAMVVNSFTQQPYCDLPECFAGWMAREKPQSGEIYEPRTVFDRLDLSANTKIAMPAVFDLETREVLWLDLSLKAYPRWQNNVAGNLSAIQLMLRAFAVRPWPSLYDLLELHVRARGTLVNAESEADTVFNVANETPFHLERIASEFLADE